MTKRIFYNSLGVLITAVIITAVIILCVFFFFDERSRLPWEFTPGRPLYQKEETHIFGPGGINQTFHVYKIRNKVSEKISEGGLPYLNSLSSSTLMKKLYKSPKLYEYEYEVRGVKKTRTLTGPWWGPFSKWHVTPIPSEIRWVRGGRVSEDDWKPSLDNFYKDEKFTSDLNPDYKDLLHKIIQSPGSFYSYGGYRGMCVLVVAPSQRRVFYLFRD